MNVKTLSYVSASELFGDDEEVWNVFCESNPDCSWGDNTHTLVTKEVIKEMDVEEYPCVQQVFDRLDTLPDDVLIDLET